MKRVFLLLMVGMLILQTSPSASAHSEVTIFSPSKNQVISSLPKNVTIKFSETPLTFKKKKVNIISVSNPNKEIVSMGETKVVGKSLIVALSSQEAVAGKYLVTYRMAAPDGHVVTGSYRFTLSS